LGGWEKNQHGCRGKMGVLMLRPSAVPHVQRGCRW